MKNRMTAPKPQLMQSRNDMLNTSMGRRRLAISCVRRYQLKFKSGRTNSERITDLQNGRAVNAMPVQEGTVTAVVFQHALAVLPRNRAMPPRHARHVRGKGDKMTVSPFLRPQDQR